jgi:hypothetical protein
MKGNSYDNGMRIANPKMIFSARGMEKVSESNQFLSKKSKHKTPDYDLKNFPDVYEPGKRITSFYILTYS